jgi:acetamidase/formamidase
MGKEHSLGKEQNHTQWDNSLEPAVEVEPGDVVNFDCEEVTGAQVTEGCEAETLSKVDMAQIYPLTGPVAVKGAEPGDALVVELLRLEHRGWAWTGILPGLGLLVDDFMEPYIYHWDLRGGDTTDFTNGISIPIDPFPGTIGVAPREPGQHFVMPPGPFGGNMDIRHLHQGTTLLLPVQVAGALFSVGDCHAAQGDGEVCVTGLEAPMGVTVRLGLLKGANLATPRFQTSGRLNPRHEDKGYFVTTGIGPDLFENARGAVREMIDWLTSDKGLRPEDAYLLCSAAGDLKISEVVDQPNWIVSFYMPLNIFPS